MRSLEKLTTNYALVYGLILLTIALKDAITSIYF